MYVQCMHDVMRVMCMQMYRPAKFFKGEKFVTKVNKEKSYS